MTLASRRLRPRPDTPLRRAGLSVLALTALAALTLALVHHPPIRPVSPPSAAGAPVVAEPGAARPSTFAVPLQTLEAAPLPVGGAGGRVPQAGLAVGTATYYGDDFQGQTMADGRRFDMNDPTVAASNLWPLGTRLRLRRAPSSPWDATLSLQERGRYASRAIVVTVSDHGEFDHALDLSRAAFAELGRPDEGVISVLIEPLDGEAAGPETGGR